MQEDNKVIRAFDTGATRDTAEGKPDYEAFLSGPVLRSFGRYMHDHRKQSDGSLRDGDNWQKGFGPKHQDVCMKSAWRHFFDLWDIHRGYPVYDLKDGHQITLEEACNAVMFNVQAILHQHLKEKDENLR